MDLHRWLRLSRLGLSGRRALLPRCFLAGNCPAAEDLAREAAALKARYAADLGRLAAWCREKNLTAEAKKTADLAAPPDPYTIVLPVLPQEVGSLHRRKAHRAIWPSGIAGC